MSRRRTTPPSRGGCAPSGVTTTDLRSLIEDYRCKYQEDAARELRFFAPQRTFEDAVRQAALAQGPGGKRLSHQRRIPSRVLRKVERVLLAALEDLQEAGDFAALHALIEDLIGGIEGVGELMVYDTTLRISAKLDLAPEAVYLHAGARIGARALGSTPPGNPSPLPSFCPNCDHLNRGRSKTSYASTRDRSPIFVVRVRSTPRVSDEALHLSVSADCRAASVGGEADGPQPGGRAGSIPAGSTDVSN